MKKYDKHVSWIILVIFSFLFFFIVFKILNKYEFIIDDFFIDLVVKLRNPDLDKIMRIITNLGGTITLISFTMVFSIFLKDKRLLFVSNLIISFIVNRSLKHFIKRPRPTNMLLNSTGFSFPSGHAMISTAVFGYFIYYVIEHVKNKVLKVSIVIFLSILVVLVGFSRIYFNVHYVTDVLGGFLIGIVYLIIFVKISKILVKKNRNS